MKQLAVNEVALRDGLQNETGIRSFDASLGGLGGCPFAPGASGNVRTESLVSMFHELGWSTGIDVDGLRAIARELPPLIGRELS